MYNGCVTPPDVRGCFLRENLVQKLVYFLWVFLMAEVATMSVFLLCARYAKLIVNYVYGRSTRCDAPNFGVLISEQQQMRIMVSITRDPRHSGRPV